MPFVAVNVTVYVPPVPASGVPANTPLGASNVTPDGNAPDSDKAGAGKPLAVTVNVPADPTVNVVAAGLARLHRCLAWHAARRSRPRF